MKRQNYGLKHSYSLKEYLYDNDHMATFRSIMKRERFI